MDTAGMSKRANEAQFPCPCCGHVVFDGPPGTHEICPICFWVDEAAALRYATTAVEAVSLVEAQCNYAKFGACEERWVKNVIRPRPLFRRESAWRPFDVQQDKTDLTWNEPGIPEWPANLEVLYYWRECYWMASQNAA